MKNLARVIIAFFLIFSQLSLAAPDVTLPEFIGGIQQNAVFANDNVENKLLNECGGDSLCSAQVLQKLGASKQAIAFAKWNSSLIRQYKNYGNIFYFTAWLPGSRFHDGVFVGNQQGQIFQIDNWLEQHKSLSNYQAYRVFLKQYPDGDTRYGCEVPPEQKNIAAQQRLIFYFPISVGNGPILNKAKIAFDFDESGNLIRALCLNC